MSKAKAKTIKLLLYEGDLTGVIKLEDDSWTYSGVLYNAPRNSVEKLLATDACKRAGVYMLLSKQKVYVGKSNDLARRINDHILGKDWWTSVLVLTSASEKLKATGISYLEATLINKAMQLHCLDCDNKNRGDATQPDEFEKVALDQYLEEALFYMELIGIRVFSEDNNQHNVLIDTSDIATRLSYGKRAKSDAVEFLRDKGMVLPANNSITYATKQPNNMECWANPLTSQLEKDWILILNNTVIGELIILSIPANTLHLYDQAVSGLKTRPDKPDLIQLKIDLESLIDKISGTDFSPYVAKTVGYRA